MSVTRRRSPNKHDMPIGDDPRWQIYGNCIGLDSSLFFPERGDAASTRRARAICRVCVVRECCLEHALVNGEKFGVWGGTSERERKKIREARNRIAKTRGVA